VVGGVGGAVVTGGLVGPGPVQTVPLRVNVDGTGFDESFHVPLKPPPTVAPVRIDPV